MNSHGFMTVMIDTVGNMTYMVACQLFCQLWLYDDESYLTTVVILHLWLFDPGS